MDAPPTMGSRPWSWVEPGKGPAEQKAQMLHPPALFEAQVDDMRRREREEQDPSSLIRDLKGLKVATSR